MEVTNYLTYLVGKGSGTDGRAVASEIRDPRFDSSYRNDYKEHYFI